MATRAIDALPKSGQAVTRIGHWIGGKLQAGTSGRSGPVFNPATGVQAGDVAFASLEEVDAAVRAAKEAFVTWGDMGLGRSDLPRGTPPDLASIADS